MLRKDTWYTQPYINSIPVVAQKSQEITYNEKTGVYTITADMDIIPIGKVKSPVTTTRSGFVYAIS